MSPRLLAQLDALARLRGPRPDPRREVRDLVLLVSSSRGGSSVFAEGLREIPGLLHLRAELNPFLRVAGFEGPDDALAADAPGDADRFARELGFEVGARAPSQDDFALDVVWRLLVQWPDRDWELEQLIATVRAVPLSHDLDAYHLAVIQAVGVEPHFYDVDRELLAAVFPGRPIPASSPGSALIEEPPFVCISPWARATAEELHGRPLVIKTPSNAYRLDWFRAMFPAARIRLLHLVRNPAAAINGLVDGWQYHGFHSRRVDEALRIPGYDEARPGDRYWWKYDVPPGWEELVSRPLAEVCAAQWCGAHEAVLDSDLPTLRVRFEDFIREPASRLAMLDEVCSWLGVPLVEPARSTLRGPLARVMSTERPRIRRWFTRSDVLEPVLSTTRVRELATRLGYGPPETWE
ncbi:MAG: sulfotransferase [Proteobacteria bacterium]|nr:sulfotransferase [Pseudomonadota bacterium]MCP4915965.1 sulfotransferase [Pseudomonadota bacterium]